MEAFFVVFTSESVGKRVGIICAELVVFLIAPRAVGIFGWHFGKLLESGFYYVAVVDGVVFVGACKITLHAHRKPFFEFAVNIDTSRKTLEVGAHGDTVLSVVAAADEVLGVVGAAAHRKLVALHCGFSENLALPVGALAEYRRVCKFLPFAPAEHVNTLVVEFGVFAQVHSFEFCGYLLYGIVAFVRDCRFASLTFFGGDEHNAVGGARTVDCSSRCVFQHFHRHDVGRVDGGQGGTVAVGLTVDGHAVDYVKRLVAVERVDTTYAYRDAAARRA